jgi:HSP20 family molecular chaperone IbpA
MSAKWRRSKRFLKWIDSEKTQNPKKNQRSLPVQKFKTPIGTHLRKYNLPRKLGRDSLREPQPLVDLFQEEDSIIVVAEIVGFNKETLKIDVKDQKLTLSAKAKDRRYYKSLNLPKEVIPNIFHTTYKNGVLEIKLRKACTPEIKK